MKPHLTVVTLGVANLVRSRKFYCEGLGFRASRASDDHIVFLDAGSIVLALYPAESLAGDANLGAKVLGFGGVTLAQNVDSRASVDAALERAVRSGAKLLKAAEETFWGGYSGYFADPDGYPWEVAYNPHWDLDNAGGVVLP